MRLMRFITTGLLVQIGRGAPDRADRIVNERLATRAVGKEIDFSFRVRSEDDHFLEQIALSYEMAAIEGLDELSRPAGVNIDLRNQAVAASYKAFEIRRLMAVPSETHDRLFFCPAAVGHGLLRRSLVRSQALD